jgi:hypothetical protein
LPVHGVARLCRTATADFVGMGRKVTLDRHWPVVGFTILALAALGVMVAILVTPVPDTYDTECASAIERLFTIGDPVCGDAIRTRAIWAALFLVAALAFGFGAWRSARR